MAQRETLRSKLKNALKALEEAPASMQPKLKKAKDALTLAIQEMGTTPGPSPNPTNRPK